MLRNGSIYVLHIIFTLIVTSRRRTTPAQWTNLVLLKSPTSQQVAGRSQPASWMKTMMRIARGRGDRRS
jgi:hypothetical protein